MNRTILLAGMIILSIIATPQTYAQRIVSLMPSATFILSDLGADAQVVGRTSYCKPATNGQTIVIGDALSTNTEAIVALNPDVVVASNFTKPATIEKLKQFGFRVMVFNTPKNLNDIAAQTKQLGIVANRTQEANLLIDKETLKIDSIAHATNVMGQKAYVQVGAKPTFGATPDYYINDLLVQLGAANILLANEGATSKETIISRKPNIIVISSMAGLGLSEKTEWQKLSDAKTTVVIDENVLCCPTMTHFRQSMEAINNAAKH